MQNEGQQQHAPSFGYTKSQPDTEGILSVKHDLIEKKCKDTTLLSNLDFAESIFRNHPMNKVSKLLVKGDYSVIKIGDCDTTVFTITSANNKPHLHIHIHRVGFIKKHSIEDDHFFGHFCQDEISPCFVQAQQAVPVDGLPMLQIKCNRFSILYTTPLGSQPSKTVETKCQIKLKTMTVEGLLEKKIYLQKEVINSHNLLKCLDYLIQLYLTSPDAPKSHCRFIIYADNEMVRIVSPEEYFARGEEYVLLHNYKGISMFPSTWQ